MKSIQNRYNKFSQGFVVLFLLMMILFPSISFQGASNGLLLWFHNVLPNLLPFIILSNIIVRLNIAGQISRIIYPLIGRFLHISRNSCYPIIIGFLAGIPMGAKSTADLVSEGTISKEEGNFLITLCNNASPMFIMGYITISQLKLPNIKYTLFIIIYCSSIISALLYRFISSRIKNHEFRYNYFRTDAVNILKNDVPIRFDFEIADHSIMNGFEVITKIGGYIILFSILAQIINEISPGTNYIKALLMGIFEMTTGISQICNTKIDLATKIVLTTAVTSFGGLSGLAQTKSVLGYSGLSIKPYIIVKIINVVLSFLITYIYVKYVMLI